MKKRAIRNLGWHVLSFLRLLLRLFVYSNQVGQASCVILCIGIWSTGREGAVIVCVGVGIGNVEQELLTITRGGNFHPDACTQRMGSDGN